MSLGKKLIVIILGLTSLILLGTQIAKDVKEKRIINIIEGYPQVDRIDIIYPDNTIKAVPTTDLELLRQSLKPETFFDKSHAKNENELVQALTLVFLVDGQELFSEKFFKTQDNENLDCLSKLGNSPYVVTVDGDCIKLDIQNKRALDILGLAK